MTPQEFAEVRQRPAGPTGDSMTEPRKREGIDTGALLLPSTDSYEHPTSDPGFAQRAARLECERIERDRQTVKRPDLFGTIHDTYATESELNGWRESQGRNAVIENTRRVFVRCYPPAETPMGEFPFEGWLTETLRGSPAIVIGGCIQIIDAERWAGYSFERLREPVL